MEQTSRDIYVNLMEEIKRRTDYIRALATTPAIGMYERTAVESVCLQLRLILENIAFSCLVANGDKLEDLPASIEKEYNADDILRSLDRVRPGCYPKPTILIEEDPPPEVPPSQRGNYRGKIEDRPLGDWLTREEFREVYGRLGGILHAPNPLRPRLNFDYYKAHYLEWGEKVINLLNHHNIEVVEEGKLFVVQMHSRPEGASPDVPGRVHLTEFAQFN